MAKVALVLSGCGFKDGSEIHESVLCLLALNQKGHEPHCFAPDITQAQVVNHLTGKVTDESRNCLVESARIARGNIRPLSKLDVNEFDALLLPGGFGAAGNLSTWAKDEQVCSVDPLLREIILEFHKQEKPIGATCIAPVILGKVFEKVTPVMLTLGMNPEVNKSLAKTGAEVVEANVAEMVADEKNKIFCTPCYMEPADLPGMYEGISKLVARLG